MSEAARNFRVGLFVFAGMIAVGSCAVILGGEGMFAPRIRFESYFDEAVTGLEVGSPVRYRGVKIGVVKSIGMLEDYYEFSSKEERLQYGQMVSILMEFVIAREEDAALRDLSYEQHRERLEGRVKEGLRLRLAQSGITGIAYIEADVLDPLENPPMKIVHTPRHIYIPSAPSTIATLTDAATRFAAKLNDVDVVQLVANLDTLIMELTTAVRDAKVDRLEEEAVGLLSELRVTNRQLQVTLAEAEVPALTAGATEAMQEATATLVRAQRMLDGGRYDLEAALENARVASENLRDLTETLKAQPSLLVRGDPPKQIEVEVGR